MDGRLKRKQERRRKQRAISPVAQRVRELFSTAPPDEPDDEDIDELEGGLGVRESRRPHYPSLSGAVALEPSPNEHHDVWAVGEDRG